MTDADNVTVTFKCLNCGADPATLRLPDDHTEDSIAECKSCGFKFGRYGDVKAKALAAVKDDVQASFKNAFRGLKGWKIK